MILTELGCVCLIWNTTDQMDHSVTGEYSTGESEKVTLSEWFGLEPVSTIRGAVHVVRSIYRVKPIGGALARPYHPIYLDRFYRFENLSQYSAERESIE